VKTALTVTENRDYGAANILNQERKCNTRKERTALNTVRVITWMRWVLACEMMNAYSGM
jgi:hypothetical protein